MESNKLFRAELSLNQWNIIINACAQRPYVEVADVLKTLLEQLQDDNIEAEE